MPPTAESAGGHAERQQAEAQRRCADAAGDQRQDRGAAPVRRVGQAAEGEVAGR